MNSKIDKNENKEKFDSDVYFKFKKELLNIDKNIKSFYKLKEAIEIVISEEIREDDDEMHKEFRGRLGAQILLSVYNAKEVTKEIANSMLINLAGSGLISTILDVFVWPPLLAIVAISCPPLYIPLSVILYSGKRSRIRTTHQYGQIICHLKELNERSRMTLKSMGGLNSELRYRGSKRSKISIKYY
uniref:Uncharacterized protein n=1 Tax=Meloidogyne enterolobii TaxID=390850 RepID=A0A6V7WIA9_MELEN|nr:unnamed protein product [Meloidogyne enterolobii]